MPVLQPSRSVPGVRRPIAPQALAAAVAVLAVAIALAVIALGDGGAERAAAPARAADHGTFVVKGARGGAFGDVRVVKGAGGSLRE